MVGGYIMKSDLEGKHVFWDVDGVLAPFRFNNKVWPNVGYPSALTQEMVDNYCFYARSPCKLAQRIIRTSNAKQNVVLGKIAFSGEMAQKELWLNQYFPEVKIRLWVSVKEDKGDILMSYMRDFKIPKEDVVFIDDTISELLKAEQEYGITAVHVSSLLNWEE
ncbi:MAG: hypothetical protein NC131_17030 [Roseburia sp.]|nr:hypothetical protein [Roseburia sp.]